MSNQEAIREWLSNPARTYAAGLALLQQTNRNQVLARNLGARESEGNFKTLEYHLQQVLTDNHQAVERAAQMGITVPHGATVIIVQAPGTPRAIAAPEPAGAGDAQGEDAAAPALPVTLSPEAQARVEAITVESSQLYTEQARLSNTLADQQSDEARASVVKQIEALKAKRDQLAEERRRLEAGEPLAPVAAVETLEQMETRRDNLRSTVSKAKKAAEKPGASAEAQARYAKKRAELDDLEVQVKHAREQQRLGNG